MAKSGLNRATTEINEKSNPSSKNTLNMRYAQFFFYSGDDLLKFSFDLSVAAFG